VAGADGVVVPTNWFTVTVPWERLHGVRRDGDRLALAWEAEQATVGPFAGPAGPSAAAESAGALLVALQQAQERTTGGAGVGPRVGARVGAKALAVVEERVSPAVRALAVYGPLAVVAVVLG